MPASPAKGPDRLFVETMLVLGLSLGRSAIYSVLSIINKLTRAEPLNQQTTTMNTSTTPDRPWLDLAYQLVGYGLMFVAPLLCGYLLATRRPPASNAWISLGLAKDHLGRDFATGFALAAGIGIPGLAFYLLAREIGINTNVSPANLSEFWWTIPLYCLAALVNAVLEEVVMIGYLFARWRQCGWGSGEIIATSAIIRGSYHLYQGFGGFIGNLVMGAAMGWLYNRTKRLWPLIVAHTLLDIAAFVGYALLAGALSWL